MSSSPSIEYDPKNMIFSRLGRSGLRVSRLSLGGWLTYGGAVKGDPVKDIIKTAFENGINFFDNAENYSNGQSEVEMGRVFKELGIRRSDIVVSSKVFSGVGRKGPNDRGLSRKHIIEGVDQSLKRLGLDYLDIVLAHRPDVTVPMEEIVRSFTYLINQGKAFYWGTSEWTALQLEEAFHVANKFGLIAPTVEQPQYSLLVRDKLEREFLPIFDRYGLGTMIWSPLSSGFLTGKYNDGIPENSRYATNPGEFQDTIAALKSPEGQAKIEKVKKLTKLAEEKLGCTVTHLSLAWTITNPNVSSCILGASKPEQVIDNLKALDVIPKLTPEILKEIDDIVQTKPVQFTMYGR
ncbi:voltage-gated potassium channel beta-2 subunit [Phaffia rhodozyma]|uniref:Voltage-gated potassium channel beta-2 subunit n=1 Tax=Phaffia rhodozyma TaxID=264483 RepID=A0A0F7SL13_PHARH|nr:voltage-gated potassium channel beta-2 subunit [Phaffia rhodozyma]